MILTMTQDVSKQVNGNHKTIKLKSVLAEYVLLSLVDSLIYLFGKSGRWSG